MFFVIPIVWMATVILSVFLITRVDMTVRVIGYLIFVGWFWFTLDVASWFL